MSTYADKFLAEFVNFFSLYIYFLWYIMILPYIKEIFRLWFEGVMEAILLTCLYNLRINYFIFPNNVNIYYEYFQI